MAKESIKAPTNISAIPTTIANTSGQYSDAALLTALINDSNIIDEQICSYSALFSGGVRTGLCFLYGRKQYGWVLCFHFGDLPRVFRSIEGVPYLSSWATS